MINITSVKKSGTALAVAWDTAIDDIKALSIIFDDEGSCTTIGLNVDDKSFSTTKLSKYRTYEIYLKALTPDGWVKSDSKTYRLA